MTSDGVDHPGIPILPTLTSLRWYAALGVFLFHAGAVTGWSALGPFGLGQQGVTFFFVLSGFVLTWSRRPTTSSGRFYLRRFARIYPSHFVTYGVVTVIGLATTGLIRTPPFGLLLGFLLLQAWTDSPHQYVYAGNAVSWSLSVEAFFYALFPGLVGLMQRLRTGALLTVTGAVVFAGALVTVVLARAGHGSTAAFNFPPVQLPQFVLGIALALLVQRGWRLPHPLAVAGVAVVLTVAVARHLPYFPLVDYALLPAIALVLLAGATLDLRGARTLLTSRVSIWLGEVSFAFYLVHEVTLLVVHRLTALPPAAEVLCSGLTALVLAAMVHHFVELPAQAWLTRSRRRARSSA